MDPGGKRVRSAAWGEGREELLRLDGAGPPARRATRGPAARAAGGRRGARETRACADARNGGSGASAGGGSRANPPRRRASCRAPAAPRSRRRRGGLAAVSEHVQFQTQFQPARERRPAQSGTPRSSSTPRSRCRVTPGALAAPGEAWPRAALALSPEALAAGAFAVPAEALTRPARSRGWRRGHARGGARRRRDADDRCVGVIVGDGRRRSRDRLPRRRRGVVVRRGRGRTGHDRRGRCRGGLLGDRRGRSRRPALARRRRARGGRCHHRGPRRRSCWSGSPRHRHRGCRHAPRR